MLWRAFHYGRRCHRSRFDFGALRELHTEVLVINSKTFIALFTVLMLAACTGITTKAPDGVEVTRTRAEFEQYVESVFRRQNNASLEAGQLLDDTLDDPEQRRKIEDAERNMLASCGALNRVAHQRMEQDDPGILLEIEVKNTIGECDFATRELERLIEAQN